VDAVVLGGVRTIITQNFFKVMSNPYTMDSSSQNYAKVKMEDYCPLP
jgi:hypothetical protein